MKQTSNMLLDFKDLAPANLSISENVIHIKSCLEFADISRLFAFYYVAVSVGYVVYFVDENITITGEDDEKEKLLIISHFIKANRDVSQIH